MRGATVRLVAVVIAVVTVASVLFSVWSQSTTQESLEKKVLAEARTLSVELQAAWDYVDDVQERINYNSDGTYDFKGVYCSVAGKGIAKRFTQRLEGYSIRYIREDPRSATDVPDRFEMKALEAFEREGLVEYYGMAEHEGEPVFRYVAALKIEGNCLDCHGAPAGEKDPLGYLKEGMALGDLAGAASIVIPVKTYQEDALAESARTSIFFVLLAVTISLAVTLVLNFWVAKPLEHVNSHLRRENDEKDDFLAVMSHELKTPLSAVLAYTEIWEKRAHDEHFDPDRLVKGIKESTVMLLGMVDNALDVVKLEAGRLPEQCGEGDIVDMLDEVFDVARPLALRKHLKLTKHVAESMPIVSLNWSALYKIVSNLVVNAIKFTDDGGSVSVHAFSSGGEVVVEVSDTGAGIDESDLERIFLRFERASSGVCEATGGSGLGLYLANGLARQLGGSISVKSEVGVGSTFSVRIPFE